MSTLAERILTPEDVQDARKVVELARIVVFSTIAMFSWELLATLPTEYRTLWRKPISELMLAYLVNRYWTLVSLILVATMLYWVGLWFVFEARKRALY